MTLKTCKTCGKVQTTKNAKYIGKDLIALYFNCTNCQSTFIIRRKNWKEYKQL